MEKLYPKVGIGVMITRADGRILMGLRKGSHGAGEWALPGGALEFGETLLACARREVLEETGMRVENLELISIGDELRYIASDNKHYVVIGFQATSSEEPVNLEPEKCAEWRWFSLADLPSPVLQGSLKIIESVTHGKIYKENI